jgi:hypothetical protein
MSKKNKGYSFQVRLIFFFLDRLNVDRAEGENNHDLYLFRDNGVNITIYFWHNLSTFYGVGKDGDTYLQWQVCRLLAKKLGYE